MGRVGGQLDPAGAQSRWTTRSLSTRSLTAGAFGTGRRAMRPSSPVTGETMPENAHSQLRFKPINIPVSRRANNRTNEKTGCASVCRIETCNNNSPGRQTEKRTRISAADLPAQHEEQCRVRGRCPTRIDRRNTTPFAVSKELRRRRDGSQRPTAVSSRRLFAAARRCGRSLSNCTSFSGSSGLTRWISKPAASERRTSSACP